MSRAEQSAERSAAWGLLAGRQEAAECAEQPAAASARGLTVGARVEHFGDSLEHLVGRLRAVDARVQVAAREVADDRHRRLAEGDQPLAHHWLRVVLSPDKLLARHLHVWKYVHTRKQAVTLLLLELTQWSRLATILHSYNRFD